MDIEKMECVGYYGEFAVHGKVDKGKMSYFIEDLRTGEEYKSARDYERLVHDEVPDEYADDNDIGECYKAERKMTHFLDDLLRRAKTASAGRRLTASFTSPFVETEVDGCKIVQVNADSGKTFAKIKGKEVLIVWDPMYWEDAKGKKLSKAPRKTSDKYKPYQRFVKWGVRQLKKREERKEIKKEWTHTKVDGYYVYDVDGKDEVAAMLKQIDHDVKPILRHFKIRYTHVFETLAEGYLGVNKRSFGSDCIGLQCRQTANMMKMKKYSAVMHTMLHELAHCRVRNHGREFQEFMNEIVEFAREKGIYRPN